MIIIKICRGTVCHVMGGSELPLLAEVLPAELKNQVSIEGTTCIGSCNKDQLIKPPFVEVNGKIIDQASIAKVIEVIKQELKNK
jgi:NADH:ubiquinone oxidoreductase subunit E